MTPRCKHCKEYLVNARNRYIHPSNDVPCKEEDGIDLHVVSVELNELFEKRYGGPERSVEEEMDELKEHLKTREDFIAELKVQRSELSMELDGWKKKWLLRLGKRLRLI